MPPKGLDSILSPILHGPTRGLGAVNRTDNDREGVIVLDAVETSALIAKLRPYRDDSFRGPVRHDDTLRDLHQQVARGSIELTGKASSAINRYAFFCGMGSLNFNAATLAAQVGRC